jgi:hypothetical protein
MDENLRVEAGQSGTDIQTIQDFRIVWNLRAAEKCNAQVIAENYLRLVVLCAQLSCHRNEKDSRCKS